MTRKPTQISFRNGIFALLLAIRTVSSAVQILYLQETQIDSVSIVYPSATITSRLPDFTLSTKYSWSAWFYKTGWAINPETFFLITLDTTYEKFLSLTIKI